MNAIEVSHVSKVYRRYSRRRQFATLKSALLSGSLISDLKVDETFQALNDASFTVPAGRTYGIIGPNGSGKHDVEAGRGHHAADQRDGHGERPHLGADRAGRGISSGDSGRENVFINGIMLGSSKREIAKRFDEIVEFAELKDFIDAPVKTYSSGMEQRLGFARRFTSSPTCCSLTKCSRWAMKASPTSASTSSPSSVGGGRTILLVTHSLGLVERFCDDALWLDKGHVKGTGYCGGSSAPT